MRKITVTLTEPEMLQLLVLLALDIEKTRDVISNDLFDKLEAKIIEMLKKDGETDATASHK